MIKLNLKIDEAEKRRILSLHENATKNNYLIIEQEAQQNQASTLEAPEPLNFTLKESFKSGESKLSNKGVSEIEGILGQVKQYSDRYGSTFDIVIKIVASESKVPQPGGIGALANARANTIESILKSNLPNVKIDKEILSAQGPEWTSGKDNKDDVKYTEHQWVTLSVEAVFDVCRLKATQADGGAGLYPTFASFDKTFNVANSGKKKVVFMFDCYELPDLVRVTYGGNVVNEFWVGSDIPLFRALIGTFIGKYKNELGLSKYTGLMNKLRSDAASTYMATALRNPEIDLKNMFPSAKFGKGNFFDTNQDIVPFMLVPNIIQKSPSGIAVDLDGSTQDLRIQIFSPLGQTRWSFKSGCAQ